MGKPYSIDLRERVVAAVLKWRPVLHRAAKQFGVGILLGPLLLALHYHEGTFESGMREYDICVLGAFVLIIVLTRRGVRRLPGFLIT